MISRSRSPRDRPPAPRSIVTRGWATEESAAAAPLERAMTSEAVPPAKPPVPAPRAASLSGTLRNRRQPVAVLRQPAADSVEIAITDQAPDRPDLAGPDRPMVDLHHGRDLDAGAAQEHLVRDIELGAVDRADADRDALLLQQLQDRRA